jgi:hypothetical protein
MGEAGVGAVPSVHHDHRRVLSTSAGQPKVANQAGLAVVAHEVNGFGRGLGHGLGSE